MSGTSSFKSLPGGSSQAATKGGSLPESEQAKNLTWTQTKVSNQQRWKLLGQSGVVVWLTGLSGSGKSTLAVALEAALHISGNHSYLLDGDNLRHGLCRDLGFSDADRTENIRRAGELASLMAEAGLIVIVALISPFRADRELVRESCARRRIPFIEVYVNAPLRICEQRDPKGLYRRARQGEIKGFTGIDSAYEPPLHPDVEVHTDEVTIDAGASVVLSKIITASTLPR